MKMKLIFVMGLFHYLEKNTDKFSLLFFFSIFSDEEGIDWALILGIALSLAVIATITAVVIVCIKRKKQETQTAVTKAKDKKLRSEGTFKKPVPLSSIIKGNVPSPSLDEFEKLTSYDDGLGQRFTTAQGQRYNRSLGLNLVPTNLPFDHNRIKLKRPIDGVDYINANWMTPLCDDDPTYDELVYTSNLSVKCIRFAVGQEQMPNTTDMYFRMIHEQKFDYVLGFTTAPKDEDSFVVGDVLHLSEMTLKVLKRTMINNVLHRIEISLFNTNEDGLQYKHNFVYLECDFWPNEEVEGPEATEVLVSAMCLIRNEMTLKNASLKVLATDTRGGVCASAVFLSMYEIMQEVDEAITHDNKLKKSATEIDVFSIVNRLRNDRDKMIEHFSTYKLLFHCLNYYGLNREALHRIKPMHVAVEPLEDNEMITSGTANLASSNHHRYVNIEEMSQYL